MPYMTFSVFWKMKIIKRNLPTWKPCPLKLKLKKSFCIDWNKGMIQWLYLDRRDFDVGRENEEYGFFYFDICLLQNDSFLHFIFEPHTWPTRLPDFSMALHNVGESMTELPFSLVDVVWEDTLVDFLVDILIGFLVVVCLEDFFIFCFNV